MKREIILIGSGEISLATVMAHGQVKSLMSQGYELVILTPEQALHRGLTPEGKHIGLGMEKEQETFPKSEPIPFTKLPDFPEIKVTRADIEKHPFAKFMGSKKGGRR